MRRLLQSIIFVLLLCACILTKAQSDYTFNNGEQTQLISFPTAGCSYTWTNNKPGIGLAASGAGDIPSFTAINNGTTPIVATIKVTPILASYAYIANDNSNTITVIDGATHQVIHTISGIGTTPIGIVASPDGKRVYTANNVSGDVSVINTADNSLVTNIPVGANPFAIAITPDSRWVYVGNQSDANIAVIDAETNMVVKYIPSIQSVVSMITSPDGKWVYAATEAGTNAEVYIISTLTNTVDSGIPLDTWQNDGMVITPDGKTLYISNNQGNGGPDGTVTVINLVTKGVSKITVGTRPSPLAFTSGPYGIAINSTGTRVYVVCSYKNEIDVINTATNTVIKSINTIPLGHGVLFTVSVSNDDKEIYVTNRNANEVYVFSAADYSKITTITDPSFDFPFSSGNFISKGPGCSASPFTFTITVKPSVPTLVAPNTAAGTISACAGSPSASPDVQQFTLSGSSLNGGVVIQAPTNFEVSLSPGSGYSASLLLTPAGGNLAQQVIYARSKQSAPIGPISGNVKITSAGAAMVQVAVSGRVSALPVVNPLGPKTYNAGDITSPVNFTGPGNTFMWSNDNTAIGLAASGVGDIASFTATNTTSSAIVGNVTVTPIEAGYAFIANKGSNDVSVINTVTGKIIKTVGAGSNPYAVAVTPDGSKAFVTNLMDKTVSIINTSDFSVKTVNVGDTPSGVIIAPDGSKAYVANMNGNSISVINTVTNAVSFISGITSPLGMTLSPDGTKLYVTSYSSDKLIVIDVATQSIISTVTVGSYPWAVILSSNGSRIYVSNSGNGSVSVLDAASDVLIKTFFVGLGPTSLAASPDGKELYVVSGAQNSVTVYSTSDYSIVSTIGMNGGPAGISYNSDGMLYVTDSFSNSVLIINPATKQVINTIAVGTSPISLGNFISKGASCTGAPVPFTITVNAKPQITAGPVTGSIVACYGMPSVNPNIQQFTVNGTDLAGDIIATAPPNFEVSLYAGSTYGSSVTLKNSGGKVTNIIVYVRSSSLATVNTTDNIVLTSPGAADVKAGVSAKITAIPTVDQINNKIYTTGDQTSKITVTGTGQTYSWENSNPSIGLPMYGNGDIPSFTAINAGPGPVQADITVTPFTGSSCNGDAIHFTITVNAIAPEIVTGSVTGNITACAGSPSASPNIQQFTVSGSNLTNDITATAPVNFEVSLSVNSGFGKSAILKQSGGKVNNVIVYVRSAASAPAVPINGTVTLSTVGVANKTVAVSGVVENLPTVNKVADQTYNNGDNAAAISFTGSGKLFKWTNDKPEIGLTAGGTGDLPAFTATNNTGNSIKATITVTPQPSGNAYITNASDGTVSVINTTTNQVIKIINVGDAPSAIAVSPDNRYVYVVNNVSGTVSVVDVADNEVKATIVIGVATGPTFAVVSPDGKYIYVISDAKGVTVVDATTNTIATTIYTGEHPLEAAITPDGKILYVTTGLDGLAIVETTTKKVNIIPMDSPRGLLMSPDGKILYITNLHGNSVTAFDTATSSILKVIPVVENPLDMAISSDGKTLYVANSIDNGILSVINTTTDAVTNVSVGRTPTGVSITPDNKYVYVTNYGSNNISVIDVAANNTVLTIPTGKGPLSMGDFITDGPGCTGMPTKFTITVNAVAPTLTHSPVTGSISACAGSPSASPNIQQFTVNGTNLNGNVTVRTSVNFEVSLSANTGFGGAVALTQSNGSINNVTVYVRSAASASAGPINGKITLSSAGLSDVTFGVSGQVNALPMVNAVANQTKKDGELTQAINFTGTGNQFRWTNDKPEIGLPASGIGDIASFKAINLTGTDITATLTVTPLKLGYAYIPNVLSNSVSVVSLATNSVIKNVAVGNNPIGVAISSKSNLVYVTNASGTTVSVIDPSDYTVKQPITVGSAPYGIKQNADGSLLFIANLNSNNVSVIDPATNTLQRTIDGFTGPIDVAFSADGKKLYVSNNRSDNVTVLSMADYTVKKIITVGNNPYGLCLSPDGNHLFVANNNSLDISVINTATDEVSNTIKGNFSPLYLSISPDGSKLYVPNVSLGSISVVDIATNAVVNTIGGFGQPTGITFSPDGKYFYVTDQHTNQLSIIDAATNNVVAVIPVGNDPVAIGNFLLPGAACDGSPVTFTITVKATLPAAISTNQLPNGINTVYGTPSSATTFTISGDNMREGIKITPPAGVEVSSDGINFSNTIVVGGAGTIPPTTIYLRLPKIAPVDNYGGPIVLTSAGASTVSPELPPSAVTPAAVTVTADAKTKDYGTLLTGGPGSAEFIVNGLQNNETAQTVTIAYGPGAAAADPVLVYTLSVQPTDLAGGTFDPKNYTITYFDADLTVVKVPLIITADNKTKVYKDPNPELTITYTGFVNGETVAQLTTLPVISTTANDASLPGNYPITVTGATSSNYDIKFNNGVLTVRPVLLALKIPNTFTPNGDGVNDTWNIVNIEAYPDCTVNIFNRWGQKVYASVGYAKSWDGLYNNAPLPVSTYYYIIDLKNGTRVYSGDITIIR